MKQDSHGRRRPSSARPAGTRRPATAIVIGMVIAGIGACTQAIAEDAGERLFEQAVRPLFIDKCVKCHGGEERESGLRLDAREHLLRGGDRGAAVQPGQPASSLLLQAVRRQGELKMPPDGELSPQEIGAIEQWIQLGAPWPASDRPLVAPSENMAKRHWAFQPVTTPEVPSVEETSWVKSPIDAFVLSKLEAAGLPHSPEADRRTLIRRVSYTLTGLPPTPREVETFVNDSDPAAYEKLVDRLLDSPHYGEHWARHWLDLARYSDTKGYVYAREERFWVHAWTYRDWVVRALNQDMPYNRFLLLQIAADQTPDRAANDLAAMGFLTVGRRFLGVPQDIIDDRIDTLCRTTMGLTVGCARCHDHKYDPIPTADYYSLYGVFASCAEKLVPLDCPVPPEEQFQKELRIRQDKLAEKLSQSKAESSNRVRSRVRDYLIAQTELDKYPAQGFDQIFEESDILPAFVRRWEKYLRDARLSRDPVWVPWHAFAKLSEQEFSDGAPQVTKQLQAAPADAVNRMVRSAFTTPPTSFRDVIDRYAALLTDVDARCRGTEPAADSANEREMPEETLGPAERQLYAVLYGPHSPCEVPDLSITHTEAFFDSATVNELWKLQGEVDRWIIKAPSPVPHALVLVDRPRPVEPRILLRGNPLNKGADVPRQFLEVLAGADRAPFEHGSGRWELAQAIIDPANPLTARVLVNRVWARHFGQGIVTTTSDFGLRCDPPSHPDLLDWLAGRFVAGGFSLKALHRSILLSSTFRQSSLGPGDPDERTQAYRLDPDNRLLWRMNRHRLTFEEFRDSMLAAAGELDSTVGGRPVDMFQAPYPRRRTLYGLVDRQYLPAALRAFDFANPDLHTPQRSETTVPQQALFFLNDPLSLERVRALAKTCQEERPQHTVRNLFQRTLQRDPAPRELEEALHLFNAVRTPKSPAVPPTVADWHYGYGTYDQQAQKVTGFTPLPHFTGQAWQGGPEWPDAKLGWVQLTATGGHPGNDRQHAAIRRWIAPRAMRVTIDSKLVHEPSAGDGIRAFIVSSRSGQLNAATVHQQATDMPVDPFSVAAGETIDFVVDVGEVLNSDQYLWHVQIRPATDLNDHTAWDSQADFTRSAVDRLDAWEQLAQVLFCTNEFLFVD